MLNVSVDMEETQSINARRYIRCSSVGGASSRNLMESRFIDDLQMLFNLSLLIAVIQGYPNAPPIESLHN